MRKAVRAIILKDDQMLLMRRNKFGREYYILVGGGVDVGETPEQALAREVMEESGLQLVSARPVFVEHIADPYGSQYVYFCEAIGDDPQLSPHSDEAKINELGQNLHTPLWFPVKDFPGISFRTPALQQAILRALQEGFPEQPVELQGGVLENSSK